MNKTLILFILCILGIFSISILSQKNITEIAGTIDSIKFNTDQTKITIKDTEIIIYNPPILNKGDKIKAYTKKNEEELIALKIIKYAP